MRAWIDVRGWESYRGVGGEDKQELLCAVISYLAIGLKYDVDTTFVGRHFPSLALCVCGVCVWVCVFMFVTMGPFSSSVQQRLHVV